MKPLGCLLACFLALTAMRLVGILVTEILHRISLRKLNRCPPCR